jgi:NAD(P)-dependent dehydrogenase (short-subunit alcohol dehydrogenase family)/acyl carrier protein
VLYLVQALTRHHFGESLRLTAVTDGLQAVRDGEGLRPEKATLPGLLKVVSQEVLEISCQSIDLRIGAAGDPRSVDRLLAELGAEGRDRTVAYRGARRYVETFEKVPLEAPADGASRLRRAGVYVLTGGLGQIGRRLAEHLARTVEARLVLLGRSVPERGEWPELLSDAEAPADLVEQVRWMQSLEEAGAEVLPLAADVARRERMAAVFDAARERFGAVHGVIHAAGLTGESAFRALEETGPAEAEQHFRAKVRGLLVLDEVLAGQDLDFCALFSSLSAVLGGLGFAAYAASNAFMDAFVRHRRGRSQVPWISIDWDGWAVSGGAVDPDEMMILPEEGMAAFERILPLAEGEAAVVVSTGDLEQRIARWLEGGAEEGPPRPVRHERPEGGTEYVEPEGETERGIAEIWHELLGIEPIGAADNFFQLGGDSLLMTQLISLLRRRFRVEVPLRAVFDAPDLRRLATLVEESAYKIEGLELADEMLASIEALSEEEMDELLSESAEDRFEGDRS